MSLMGGRQSILELCRTVGGDSCNIERIQARSYSYAHVVREYGAEMAEALLSHLVGPASSDNCSRYAKLRKE